MYYTCTEVASLYFVPLYRNGRTKALQKHFSKALQIAFQIASQTASQWIALQLVALQIAMQIAMQNDIGKNVKDMIILNLKYKQFLENNRCYHISSF